MRAGAAVALAVVLLVLAWRPACAPWLVVRGADEVMRAMTYKFNVVAAGARVGVTGVLSGLMLPFVVVEADAPRGTVAGIVLALPDALWNLLWDELHAAELPPRRWTAELASACAC
jgi:hypothetical protein